MDVMRSVLGMVVLLTIAFLLSVNKKKISLRTVGAALVLQVVIGGIMLWLLGYRQGVGSLKKSLLACIK